MKRRLDESNGDNKEKVFSKYKVPLIKKQEQKNQMKNEKKQNQEISKKKKSLRTQPEMNSSLD